LQGFPATSGQGLLRAPTAADRREDAENRRRAPSPCQCSARAAQDIWEHHRPAVGSSMRLHLAAYTAPQRSDKGFLGALGGRAAAPHSTAPTDPRRGGGILHGARADPRACRARPAGTAGRRCGCGVRTAVVRDPTRCEPEASGRKMSHSLSESTRQITPPIRSGHAPPSTESRKSFSLSIPAASGPSNFPRVGSN